MGEFLTPASWMQSASARKKLRFELPVRGRTGTLQGCGGAAWPRAQLRPARRWPLGYGLQEDTGHCADTSKPRPREVLGCQRPGAGQPASLSLCHSASPCTRSDLLLETRCSFRRLAQGVPPPSVFGHGSLARLWLLGSEDAASCSLLHAGAQVPEPLGTGRRAIGLLAGSWHLGPKFYARGYFTKLQDLTDLAFKSRHSCAILDDQTSKCWGSGAEST